MTKYYLATNFDNYPLATACARELLSKVPNSVVTSSWLDVAQSGINDITSQTLTEPTTRIIGFAQRDIKDVSEADVVVSITTGAGRGGRHVEFGYALATNKRLVVIGKREHIFHCLPQVEVYSDWLVFLEKEVISHGL